MKTDEIKETKEKLQNIISLLDDVLSGKLAQGKLYPGKRIVWH